MENIKINDLSWCNNCEDLVEFTTEDTVIEEVFQGIPISYPFTIGKCKICGCEVGTDNNYAFRKSEAKWAAVNGYRENTVSEKTYTEEYTRRKEAEFELYKLQDNIDKMIAEIEEKIIKNKCCEHRRWEKERNEARLEDLDIINKYCKGDPDDTK